MGKEVSTEFVDDMDGSRIADGSGETVEFSVSGVDYVIDLKSSNATEFHRKLDRYIKYATRVGGRRRKTLTAGARTPIPTIVVEVEPGRGKAVRQWAAAGGYDISRRGRISSEIKEAYNAAH
ncbi:Lsr2 family protein [Rhodococcoides fascians A21d2]|uniref:histone-like nucleoid-structuring protein Lsr2 n=2 Tax=Mycobacteriales TaxID=85007 RepID=UPI00055BE763|nr:MULTISPECIES: Lsr2 family protein [Rhodococcus]OZE74202.1 Lsr2 family protein [Rhodococcus sp. 15-649-2-2]QII01433.1 Lsr2 family protein [Rhodococcus fascians A21d2]